MTSSLLPGASDAHKPDETRRQSSIPLAELERLARSEHDQPHAVLGQHPDIDDPRRVTVRALRPLAEAVSIVFDDATELELEHLAHGVFEGDHERGLRDYRIRTRYPGGTEYTAEDPYRFLPTLGSLDLYLIGEGRHERLWTALGARVATAYGVDRSTDGVAFAVWAPNAHAVRVTGSFNSWDGRLHIMRRLDGGVFELFVPELSTGATYKFQILSSEGDWIDKADPLARRSERPPQTASIIEAPSTFEWTDATWMVERARGAKHREAVSIYELHLGSWREGLTYRSIAADLIDYVTTSGFTHVEFMPLAEHPYAPSWGYQVSGYYSPTARFGTPDDLRYLINELHSAGIGVLLDWVPAHFPKDQFALARFDGTPLYEHPDPRLGEQSDWGTLVFDFGRRQVRNFLVANALYWLSEFHIDGLRVDAVASMIYRDYSRTEFIPNADGGNAYYEAIDLLKETNAVAYRDHPGVMMIAEESTSFAGVTRPTSQGGLGFGFKWNMGWMNDTLRYFGVDPMWRAHHHGELTFSFVYAWSEQFILPISHDEVVHGKGTLISRMPGDTWKKFAGVRLFLAYQWSHPGKKLLFMGQEFAQWSEWSSARELDWWSLDQPAHAGIATLVGDLNRGYRALEPMHQLDGDPRGLEWIDGSDSGHSVLAFIRRDEAGRPVVVVANFSGETLYGYRVGLPHGGSWIEALNTDSTRYGGTGSGNLGRVTAENIVSHGRTASVALTIPALAIVWLVPDDETQQ